ncbi:MAG: synthase subunit [Alphaproteobacteria bacterium]|jgi:F-type H+-transporting ATPase subunit a|nr:synthase subunit [Alphaproteobacteria bacterium]MDF3034523.1 synthase subunit [Alphaproteobacteria bacterium]
MVDPLYQFKIRPLIHLEWGGWDISFTNSSLFMVLATLILIMFFSFSVNARSLIPNRLQMISELLYTFVSDMIQENTGKAGLPYFPYIFSLFLFILMGNMLGMVPYGFTFTSHIIVTFSLAFMAISFITVLGIVRHKWRFLRLFCPENTPVFIIPLLVPIEIMSYLTRSVSLSIRLFANMIAGHAMLKLFAGFAIALAGTAFFPVALASVAMNVAITGFEFLIALLQAYIFTILTCIYLHDALNLH